MSDFDSGFWRKPQRPKAEIVAEAMARLTSTPATEAPPAPALVPSLYSTDEQRIARQDAQDGLDGALAESEERQRRLRVWRGVRYTAGSPESRGD